MFKETIMPIEKLLSIIEKAIRKTLVVSNMESFHFTAEEIIKELEKQNINIKN